MKKILTLLLTLTLALSLSVPALAADRWEAENAAWTLYNYGLFQGMGTDEDGYPIFSLDTAPTRAQSVTMLVRLLGKEAEAMETEWTEPFTDVPEWAQPYVEYAYEQGLAQGRGEGIFDAETPVSASEYLTFVLRALGYESGLDFQWDSAWTLSDRLRLTDGSYRAGTPFDRGDVAVISLDALSQKPNGEDASLLTALREGNALSDSARCEWEETCIACQKGSMTFIFLPTAASKEAYTKFTIDDVTVNGQPCTIAQSADTAKAVRNLLAKLKWQSQDKNTFALAQFEYDEAAAKKAATDTVTGRDGKTYPVLTFRLTCTGTLETLDKNRKKVTTETTERFVLNYFADSYFTCEK